MHKCQFCLCLCFGFLFVVLFVSFFFSSFFCALLFLFHFRSFCANSFVMPSHFLSFCFSFLSWVLLMPTIWPSLLRCWERTRIKTWKKAVPQIETDDLVTNIKRSWKFLSLISTCKKHQVMICMCGFLFVSFSMLSRMCLFQ